MLIDQLGRRLCASEPMEKILAKLAELEDATLAVPQSARPFVLASLFARMPRPTIAVVSGEDAAERFANSLASFIGRENVLRLPCRKDYPWQEASTPDLRTIGLRCEAIHALATGKKIVVVASARALLRCVPPREADVFSPLCLARGAELSFDALAQDLVDKGYLRLDAMEGPGTFSLRGDTLDIYPANLVYPVRAEFFGDEIDGLRRIVPATGQAIGDLDEADIYPCREFALSTRGIERAKDLLGKQAQYNSELASKLEMLGQGIPFAGRDVFLPSLYRQTDTPFAHIAKDALVVLAEPRALFDDAARYYDELDALSKAAKQQLEGLFVKPAALDFGEQQRLVLLSIMRQGQTVDATLEVKRPEVRGTEERLCAALRSLIASKYMTVLSIPDYRARQSIELVLSDAHLPFTEAVVLDKDVINVTDTDIPSGLVIPDAQLGIVSLADASSKAARRTARREIDPTTFTFAYKPGDYVVHALHGIALFKDIVQREVAGIERDYLLLEYAKEDKLYVPVEQVDQVTRYVGPEGASPRLTRLNTSDWTRVIGKARKSAKKLAFDLVDLYARRSTVTGFKYSPDTPWQLEMEQSFPFNETLDQLAAIADVKADMESSKPMDRLICGDVGFGKTEVVLRAAFKAVQDHVQVMVLCPTTILAQQHFTTFSERFEPFGVSVEVLSRFRTNKQQQAALEGFAAGTVDVLIGTHRLLSRDVNPKNLGLVIIDEEQRFGVQHKEQLKNLREQVDVITLSATPIPRTMQMAISGVRDMSLIETAPPERAPVQVHVGEWDEDVVSAAIRAEMARGGQIYYVSNRVRTIEDAVARVTEAAPEARIGVAHGQMSERQLEAVMEAFSAREVDVLVATTIIESGIDNPHTNTLIIEDSQRLGLAQLYQLKGRVGRSYAQAFAYFLFPSHSALTEQAADRLEAIAEFQELGSGTKIAMRDLEIRGAGTLMGAEQSGNMSAVGFDLFANMLAEAVSEARGEDETAHIEVRVDLPQDFFLPEEYIPAADMRVLYYRRLAAAVFPDTIEKLADEVRAAYGAMPEAAANLFDRARIKALAGRRGITNVALVGSKLNIEPLDLGGDAYKEASRAGAVYVEKKRKLIVPVPISESPAAIALQMLQRIDAAMGDDEDES